MGGNAKAVEARSGEELAARKEQGVEGSTTHTIHWSKINKESAKELISDCTTTEAKNDEVEARGDNLDKDRLGELSAVFDLEIDEVGAFGNGTAHSIGTRELTIAEVELCKARSVDEEGFAQVRREEQPLKGERLEGVAAMLDLRHYLCEILGKIAKWKKKRGRRG